MYLMKAILEVKDDQNEVFTIKDAGESFVEIDEKTGTVILYPTVTVEVKHVNSKKRNFYTVHKVPCTIYRNLKKITIKEAKQVSWKYIKFKTNAEE